MGLLPTSINTQTQGTGLDVHAVLEPAHQVGGDLYEVLRLSPDRRAGRGRRRIGQGHSGGVVHGGDDDHPAQHGAAGTSPSKRFLRLLNDELLEQNPRGMFVTLQLMVFDTAARTVTRAGAGHHAAAQGSRRTIT